MQNSISVEIADLKNPYREVIAAYLSRHLQASTQIAATLLDSVTAEMVSSGKIRFGPSPSPESLVVIREVIARSIQAGTPIPVLCPWGSKKPNNTGIDVAELGALKTLLCLQERVTRHYPPGLDLRLRIEDIGGYYLFADQGPRAREASIAYVSQLQKLIAVVNPGFIHPVLESQMMTEAQHNALAEKVRPYIEQYIVDTDEHGFDDYQNLPSWLELREFGWQGLISIDQRNYYRQRYACLYPGTDQSAHTKMLATYLAGSLTRHRLKATGARSEWGKYFIQLNFAPPVPDTPSSLGDRRIYYRTLPENLTRTHLPPWRARGYLKIAGREVVPKLASWSEPMELEPVTVCIKGNGQEVDLNAPIMNV